MTEEKLIYEVAKTERPAVVNFEEYAMTEQGVLKQVQIIQSIMHGVMKQDEHYGTIPGTKKPSLYKAGAEKLSLTFRLRPEYEIRRSDLPNGHREYEVVCTLYHIPTGQSVGQGVGSATTMEGKYRYRGGEKVGTGQPVPKTFWNLKKTDGKAAQALIGGPGFSAGKIDGNWEICSTGEKMEHDNPADYWNTILKMAKKRAHVDAILTATAASDIFTQDIEDMPEVIPGAKKEEKIPENKTPTQRDNDVQDFTPIPENPTEGQQEKKLKKKHDKGMAILCPDIDGLRPKTDCEECNLLAECSAYE
uniref:Uncharacterized protein n=1 Tax=viral metagenome TaxID=1070528 RepID=A0A6M3IT48_9ZZZZ